MLIVFAVLIQSCGTTGGPRPQNVGGAYSEAQELEDLASLSTGAQRAVYQLSAAEALSLIHI